MTSGTKHSGPGKTGPIQHPLTAWAVLAICCLATFIGWSVSRSQSTDREFDRFQIRVRQITTEIHSRIHDYENALFAARAFLSATPSVNRRNWQAFVKRLDIPRAYPGIDGIGYIAVVPVAGLPDFLAAQRADGAPGFSILPEGERPDYFLITYTEPIEWNQPAIGFDIGSDPLRRAVAESARDSGQATLTPRLSRQPNTNTQPAVLLLLPVYEPGTDPTTVAGRRTALRGWVYEPFRIADVMAGVVYSDAADVDF